MARRNISESTRKYLANVMNLAWSFVKKNGLSLSQALKAAWANCKLVGKMRQGICSFRFAKVCGEIRQAWGTLKDGLVPPTGDGRRPNDTVQVYYDTEKQAWRSFKKVNLLAIC